MEAKKKKMFTWFEVTFLDDKLWRWAGWVEKVPPPKKRVQSGFPCDASGWFSVSFTCRWTSEAARRRRDGWTESAHMVNPSDSWQLRNDESHCCFLLFFSFFFLFEMIQRIASPPSINLPTLLPFSKKGKKKGFVFHRPQTIWVILQMWREGGWIGLCQYSDVLCLVYAHWITHVLFVIFLSPLFVFIYLFIFTEA